MVKLTFREQLEVMAGIVLGALTIEEQERVWQRAVKARELRHGVEPGGAHDAVAAYIAGFARGLQDTARGEWENANGNN